MIDSMDDMCNLMCNNIIPASKEMNRKELACAIFDLIKKSTNHKENTIWKAIAETDDDSLLSEYERLKKEVTNG